MAGEENAPKKPRLMDCLERLEAIVQELRATSEEYATVKEVFKSTSQTGTAPEGMDLSIVMPPGRSIVLPWPANPEAVLGVLDEAAASLGGRVAELWTQAHEITNDAAQTCAAARERAETAPPGGAG